MIAGEEEEDFKDGRRGGKLMKYGECVCVLVCRGR